MPQRRQNCEQPSKQPPKWRHHSNQSSQFIGKGGRRMVDIRGLADLDTSQSYCSPDKMDNYVKTNTCYTKTMLLMIVREYNRSMDDDVNKIKDTNVSKKTLLKELHAKLDPLCDMKHESCWINLDFMKMMKSNTRHELQNTFRPIQPTSWKTNNRTWLNTYDIINVLHQYERKYPSFKFLGVHPINFDEEVNYGNERTCVSNELCHLDIRKLLKADYTQIGAVFNLDRHDEPGSHWVCFYACFLPRSPNYGCYFIDSNSTETPSEIKRLMHRIKLQIKDLYSGSMGKKFNIMENRKQFQFKNTECGMFSIYFMIKFLEKHKFNDIINLEVDDEDVHKFRNIYYMRQ
jgi:hypothetical protein